MNEGHKTFDPASSFAGIDTWVFDLDNTLYPAHCDLWPKIDMRITYYMCEMFGIDGMSSRALQKYYYRQYGTTMHGLIAEHGINPHTYLEFVHDIDRSSIPPDPALAQAISALPGRKLIFTNGSHDHALKTIHALGLDGLFDAIFDIVATEFTPKPRPEAFHSFFSQSGIDPGRSAMIEDIERNLVAPHAAGMTTVLVTPVRGAQDHREDWEIVHEAPEHVHHVTDNLSAFLAKLTERP